jgi:hypothetical protein
MSLPTLEFSNLKAKRLLGFVLISIVLLLCVTEYTEPNKNFSFSVDKGPTVCKVTKTMAGTNQGLIKYEYQTVRC